ncbi:MAG: hypothetical protein L0387_30815 [Acidobacteria bacterium]|nr:hypothetical protein [Acidobacteriota bacterium]
MPRVEGYLSKLYNEAGLSREEVVKEVRSIFATNDLLRCRYRVLSFKQFPDSNLASIKAVFELTAEPKGAMGPRPLIQTMGYGSLIFEDGQWKLYATQFYASPQIPDFKFEEVQGDWPSWGTQISTNRK